METRAGTSFYMAPEVISKDYTELCDYWSLGVLLYIMLSGYPPFDGETPEEIHNEIQNISYTFEAREWYEISPEARDLISKLLVKEEERLNAKQILRHPWVKKFYHDRLSLTSIQTLKVDSLLNHTRASKLKKAVVQFIAMRANREDILEEEKLFKYLD